MEKHSIILYILLGILVTNLVAAWFRFGLFPVAAICCAVTYLIEHFI